MTVSNKMEINPPIAINSMTWHEISHKVSFTNINKLNDLLNGSGRMTIIIQTLAF